MQEIFPKTQLNQKRRLRPAFIKLQVETQPLTQFSLNILNEINSQLKPSYESQGYEEVSRIKPDTQPCAPEQKIKSLKTKTCKQIKQKQPLFRKKQKKITLQRMSFETKLMKLEQQNQTNSNKSMNSLMKFPSQMAIICKQKAIPLNLHEKQQHIVEICRMFKQNYTTIEQQNTKEHQAFIQSQAQKLKNCQIQKSKTPPILGFNYDGSIMTVTPFAKKIKNDCISCVGCELEEKIIEPLLEYGSSGKSKQPFKQTEGVKFQKLEQVQSGYIENFEKIKWNPKITVEYSSKFRASFRKSRDMESIQGIKGFYQGRSRANTLSGNKMVPDEKSKIKIFSCQAYEEHLLTKPVQINGKRSYVTNQLQNKSFGHQFQKHQINKSNFSRLLEDQQIKQKQVLKTKYEETNKLKMSKFLGEYQQGFQERPLHIRSKSVNTKLNKRRAMTAKNTSPTKQNMQKRDQKVKGIQNNVHFQESQKIKKGVKKHTRSKPTYDALYESKLKWRN